ncbi:MAG: branched-chain amino acid ABC transporter permease [Bacillota bacterium]|nr:MAG: branched-chain amino acid ABC transporter permease [Bacillota bacterium]
MARTGSFSMNRRNSAWMERGGWPWLAFVAVAAVLPLVLREFHVHLLTEILILGLFAAAFNLLFGYTGLLSFGQAAYFAIGAYACALWLKGPWPSLPVGLIAGAVLAAAAALVVGYLCVRRDEIYFAMVTLACGQLIFVALWRWREVTGGSDGIGGIPRPPLDLGAWALNLAPTLHFYYFTLAVVAGALYVLWRITRSPFGLALRAVRDNHRRVDYLGLPMRRYRLAAFTVSGLFCGLAGALFAPYQGTITPVLADWMWSAEPVMMTLLGGPAVFGGPVLGAALITLLKDFVASETEYWPLLVGTAVVLLVLFLPGGVGGAVRDAAVGWRAPSPPIKAGDAGEEAV